MAESCNTMSNHDRTFLGISSPTTKNGSKRTSGSLYIWNTYSYQCKWYAALSPTKYIAQNVKNGYIKTKKGNSKKVPYSCHGWGTYLHSTGLTVIPISLWCMATAMSILPAAEHHGPLASTRVYCMICQGLCGITRPELLCERWMAGSQTSETLTSPMPKTFHHLQQTAK